MAVRRLVATLAMMMMAAPAMATPSMILLQAPDASVAKQLYPTSPISDEGWQTLGHVLRIEADSARRQPDVRKAEQPDNRQG